MKSVRIFMKLKCILTPILFLALYAKMNLTPFSGFLLLGAPGFKHAIPQSPLFSIRRGFERIMPPSPSLQTDKFLRPLFRKMNLTPFSGVGIFAALMGMWLPRL